MRLIDADKLILHLNDYALQKSPSDVESAGDRKVSRAVYKAITDCIRAVDEQPTAFDLDKVMEQLEDRSALARPVGWSKAYEIIMLKDAIEIVRGGGLNEISRRNVY